MNGHWIKLMTSSGTLASVFVKKGDDLASTIIELVKLTGEFHDGDSITIESGWSEGQDVIPDGFDNLQRSFQIP